VSAAASGNRPGDLAASRAVQVAAQAKINLRLRILAREASGFHQLETLFLRLDLADTVRVRRTAGARSLDVAGLADGASLGPVQRNLAWRAAAAHLDASGDRGGFAIELEKDIPVGGGLGGGSADAAAVLRALDVTSPTPLGEPALLRLAATLGADVPFLASGHPYALGWGRGERLLPLTPPPARRVVLAIPDFGVDTAAAYRWLAESRGAEPAPVQHAGVLDPTDLGIWEGILPLAANDFEPVVGARHPVIPAVVRELRVRGCAPAMMSGSGSVAFGVLPADAGPAFLPLAMPVRTILTRTATRVEPVVALD
jgi:4-diphosphocytidyl-2-C-methyl-D-erythritol kinase